MRSGQESLEVAKERAHCQPAAFKCREKEKLTSKEHFRHIEIALPHNGATPEGLTIGLLLEHSVRSPEVQSLA
jgi:hypothetical protein